MTYTFLIEKKKIIVFATIKGLSDFRRVKFIIDTGSSKTVIDEDVAIRNGFEINRLNTGDRLMTAGGGKNSKILRLPKFNLFGKDMVNFEVNVIRFPLQITLLADGVLGMDFLLQFKTIKFNFDAKTIEI